MYRRKLNHLKIRILTATYLCELQRFADTADKGLIASMSPDYTTRDYISAVFLGSSVFF